MMPWVGELNAASAVVVYLFLFWVEHIPEQQTKTNNATRKKEAHGSCQGTLETFLDSFYDCQNNRTHIQYCKTCGNSNSLFIVS